MCVWVHAPCARIQIFKSSKITVIFFSTPKQLLAVKFLVFLPHLLYYWTQCIFSKKQITNEFLWIRFQIRINIEDNDKKFVKMQNAFWVETIVSSRNFGNFMNKTNNRLSSFFLFSLSLLFQMAYFHTLSFADLNAVDKRKGIRNGQN